jgi:hypothetical protein
MDHPRPNLRYLAAGDLADSGLNLKGIEVDSGDGEKLGKVDGFIVDALNGRPYHVVVAAGGWFSHKHVLVPIGHAMLSGDGKKLIADVAKERVKRFPGFDPGTFDTLSDDDLKELDRRMAAECCPDEVVAIATWDVGSHYRYPDWWKESYYRSEAGSRRS